MTKKAVLTISFGTSVEAARKMCIDPIEELLAKTFSDRAAYTAWTSGRIVEKLRAERGECHDTLEEALARIIDDGVEDLLAVPTCLMQGFEMRRITRVLAEHADCFASVRLAAPLLYSADDRRALAEILVREYGQIADDEMTVFMGHGSAKGGNEVYFQMADELADLGQGRYCMATIEGEPSFDKALNVVRERSPRLVHLVPFMIVAGEHATVDMAGDSPDSWASRLLALGFSVDPIICGIGQIEAVRELVVGHAHAAQTLGSNAGEDA